jgi:hypothetical protein
MPFVLGLFRVFVPHFGDLIAINSSLVPHFGECQIIAICFFVWMCEILLINKKPVSIGFCWK